MDWEEAGKPNGQQVPGGGGGSGVPKTASKGKNTKRAVLIVLAVIVVLGLIGGLSRCGKSSKTYEAWPTTGLATMLPDPDSSKIDVSINSDKSLYVSVDDYTSSQFEQYIEACKQKGFTVDAEKTSNGFEAYAESGEHLSLSLYTDSMDIRLEAAVALDTISWPTSGPGAALPKPASDKGSITTNSSTMFSATIGNTSKQDFSAYADAVSAAGFNVDFSKTDTSFRAKNADGASVDIDYVGNNLMEIVTRPAKDSASSTSSTADTKKETAAETKSETPASEKAADTAASTSSNGVTPAFKDMMDGYESIMNKYCDFMEKYNSSSDTTSMLADYSKIMAEYAEWTGKIEAVDQASLSEADNAYYIEVTGRVTQRLSEVSV